MIYFKLIFVIFILFTFSTKASDLQIIELHKNKSLDQLVLEKENNKNEEDNETFFDLDNSLISIHFANLKNIKSKTLHREFINILSSVNLEDENIVYQFVFFCNFISFFSYNLFC